MAEIHRKQCKRFDVPGEAHFLTFSCFRRLPLLNRDRTRNWTLAAIQQAAGNSPFDLWAYVIMPEHVHLVLLPHRETNISSILSAIKQSVAKRALLWIKEHTPTFLPKLLDSQPSGKKSYRFWQRGGGYDRNLRSVNDIHEKILYVHQNPVRRELVRRATDWPWSSASAWATGSDQPIPINRESVPTLHAG